MIKIEGYHKPENEVALQTEGHALFHSRLSFHFAKLEKAVPIIRHDFPLL